MVSKTTLIGVLMDEQGTLSFQEMCQTCHLSETVLVELVEHGVLNLPEKNWQDMQFDYQMVLKIRAAQRLQQDLGVNLPGVALILDLLQELESTQSQLQILRRHVEIP